MPHAMDNCVALYDWHDPLDRDRWLAIAMRMFQAIGAAPSAAAILHASGRDSELITPESLKARLASNEEGVGIGLYALKPDWQFLGTDWTIKADLIDRGPLTMLFCWQDTLCTFDERCIIFAIEEVLGLCRVPYGIGFQLPRSRGADAYALGMVMGLGYSAEERQEADATGAWMWERMGKKRYLEGMLRDVYRVNVLSRPHVERRMHGVTLSQWIASEPGRGSLRPLATDHWIWCLKEHECGSARAALGSAGLLICWPEHDRRRT